MMMMMTTKTRTKSSVLLVLLILSAVYEVGFCRYRVVNSMKRLVGVADFQDTDSTPEIQRLAGFAIDEYNKKQNDLLVLSRVLKVKDQGVAGKLYHLTLEATDAGNKKIYEATVWEKPWMNFRQLREFKHVSGHALLTSAKLMQNGLGWQQVPTQDPQVRKAADLAVKTISRMSNSVFPYQLLEILQAKAELLKEFVKYNLLLKLKRDVHEEKFEVEVQKSLNGNFVLKLVKRSTDDQV